MSSPLPDLADPWRLAEVHKTFSGRKEPASFLRLRDAVERVEEGVDFELRFAKTEAGHPVVEGEVKARLVMRCQRCLEPVEVPVESAFQMGFIATEEEADRLPDGLDPWVTAGHPVRLQELLEDELLLSLPLVPMHPQGECSGGDPAPTEADDAGAKRDNPFAVLAALKTK